MTTFASTLNPTPFGFFDNDTQFQGEADNMVTFVKRKLGDDVLSVELTKKQIWADLEEATLEFGALVNRYQAVSTISSFLGHATGSLSGSEGSYPRQNLQFMERLAEAYSLHAEVGGAYDAVSGSITLVRGQQDYDIYDELKDDDGNLIFQTQATGSVTKMKIREVFHYNPIAAYRFFDTTSAINYLNNEFAFESFTPETIFYVLPVFEDILRAGMLELSHRVRRSNYSYKIIGRKIRIFPTPTRNDDIPRKLWMRVQINPDPINPSFQDDSIRGVSNIANIPFGNLVFENINSIGRQWIRQYTAALSMIRLGRIRSKVKNVPIMGTEMTLDGDDLIAQGREDRDKLKEELIEMLESMTYDAIQTRETEKAEALARQLRMVPVPGGPIWVY